MSSFPSSQERTVASALLLLCTTPLSLSLSPPRFDFDLNESAQERSVSKSCTESFVSSDMKSSSSSLIYDDGSSQEIKVHRSRLLSAAARCRELAFKVVRKSRTKTLWASSDPKPNSDLASKASSTSVSTEASSCLSSSSSGKSSARSLRYRARARGEKLPGIVREPKHAKHAASSPHIRRRADAILKFLSDGGSSEVRIRHVLGDTPDTSKALRMLLRLDEVKRSGSGGRHDPYNYTIAG